MTIDGQSLDELLEQRNDLRPAPNPVDEKAKFLRAQAVADRYDVVVKTIDRWTEDPHLKFPQPIWVHKIRFWREAAFVAWERSRARAA
jgi:hypothetical protein